MPGLLGAFGNKNAQPKDCRMEQLLQNRSEFKSLSTARQPAVAEALSLGKTQTLQEKRPLGRAQVFHTHRQAQAREVRGGNPDPEMAWGDHRQTPGSAAQRREPV